ncbi:MAG: hypothetical protein VYA51_09640, partial [Planctomycetota bacterium]|nr:hypothetical protein [Planctomycetota bacterium]
MRVGARGRYPAPAESGPFGRKPAWPVPSVGPTAHPEALFWRVGSEPNYEDAGMTIESETKKQIISENRRHD